MEDPNVLYLDSRRPEGTPFMARTHHKKIVVAMSQVDTTESGLYLPGSGRMTPDVGTVVDGGPYLDIDGTRMPYYEYLAGDFVACRPQDGHKFWDASCKWAVFGPESKATRRIPVWESVPMALKEDGTVVCKGDWALVRREKAVDPNFVKVRAEYKSVGMLLASGPLCPVKEAKRLVFFVKDTNNDVIYLKNPESWGLTEDDVLLRTKCLQGVWE